VSEGFSKQIDVGGTLFSHSALLLLPTAVLQSQVPYQFLQLLLPLVTEKYHSFSDSALCGHDHCRSYWKHPGHTGKLQIGQYYKTS
jgi:hypothetical protein